MAGTVVASVTSNRFPEIARKLPQQAGKAVEETLLEMLTYVRTGMAASGSPSSPGDMPGVDLGVLINSLGTGMETKTSGAFYAGAEYAVWLEFGTHKMAPRPFAGPAAEYGRRVLMEKLRELERGLR